MSVKLFKPFLWVGILILVVGMACNLTGSGSQEPVTTEAPDQPEETEAVTEATEAPATEAPETEEPDSLAVSSLEGVQNAVIQIEAQGTFVNPDFTVSFNSAGLGSGFIIDPSGLAVTNNHVVTGAALFKVWIGGDRNTTYNARVLGVSECSDLAVIDIEGDGFPYLEWHEGPINVGLEIYAAGYPLGEPQFTLTKGIVSKEKAGGETSWASVDYVIEHDATINPGNSGGPLVDEDGRVVGVNYSGRQTSQYYAIGRDLAVRTIDTLKGGKDMETFGINGEAFAGDSFSGIWVYSVKSGSPADKAGLTGGDIVTTLQDLILSSDGTMADYCDILRSHSSDATLDIEVLRYFTQEILVGQINGRELETAYNFAETVEEQGDVQVDDTGGYSGYTMVTDDYGSIQMEIPNEWVDTNGGYWIDGEDTIGAAISAAADLDSYNTTWDESGVFFGASDDLARLGGYVNLLDVRRDAFIDSCKLDGRYDYEDAIYRGKYDLFTNCGDSGNAYIVLTAVPNDNSQAFLILVEIQITNEADFDALDRILATFEVIGILP
jgi:serine protease Do